MALDPHELRRRRQARAAERARKQRQLRLTLIGVGAAVVLLMIATIIIFSVAGSNKPPTEPPQTSGAAISATESPEGSGTARLVFGGDLNINDTVVAAAGSDYDYSRAFLDVAPILAGADVTALNFEGNLCGAPYGTQTHSAPPGLVKALSEAGVDLLQLANSYTLSEGLAGLSTTIDGVRAAGMEPLGVYATPDQRHDGKGFTMVEVNGLKIAYVAFTKGMDGTTLPAGNEDCVNLLYTDYNSTYQTIDKEGIKKILADVQAQKPDYVVAMVHWGSEYNDNVSSSQKSICNLLKENGVNAVIGTHPHFLHYLSHDTENNFFVAYSLGDFFGDASRAGTEYSILLELTVTRDPETGLGKLESYSYTPIFISAQEPQARILRLNEAIAAYNSGYIDRLSPEAFADMEYALKRIDARVIPPKEDQEES